MSERIDPWGFLLLAPITLGLSALMLAGAYHMVRGEEPKPSPAHGCLCEPTYNSATDTLPVTESDPLVSTDNCFKLDLPELCILEDYESIVSVYSAPPICEEGE